MLYLRSLLNNNITDPVLQRSILSTSVVNPSGKRRKAIASNKQLELYNLDYTIDYKVNANSIYDIAATFRKVALNRESNRKHRDMFESGISIEGSNSYSYKDDSVDIFSQGDKLFTDGLISTVLDRIGTVSRNIFVNSAALFIDKVEALNVANNRIAKGISYLVQSDPLYNPLDNVDAEERRNSSADRSNIVEAVIDVVEDQEYAVRARNALTIRIDSVDSIDITVDADGTVIRSAIVNQQYQQVTSSNYQVNRLAVEYC